MKNIYYFTYIKNKRKKKKENEVYIKQMGILKKKKLFLIIIYLRIHF